MRVCVIGTSNAIYKDGYTRGIADHDLVTQFEKFPLGASPSVIIPYFSSELDFSSFDLVIFETTINDANYYKHNSIRKDQIRQFLEWGVYLARTSGCRAAMVIMPTIRGLARNTSARLIYQKVATETGSFFYDGFERLREIARQQGVEPNKLFIDEFHVQKNIAYSIGSDIIEKIAAASATTLPLPIKLKSEFYRMDISASKDSLYSDRVVSRSTSLTSASFLRLEDSRPIILRVPPGDELAGIAYNAAHTTGTLSAGGRYNNVVKSLRTKYTGTGKDLQLFIAPVTGLATGNDDWSFEIRLADPTQEVTEHSRFERFKESTVADSVAEISSFIFRRPRKKQHPS